MSNTITFKIDARPTWSRKARSKTAASAESEGSVNEAAPAPKAPTVSRLARMLALAHHIEQQIEAGELRDAAHAARLLRVSRARMTQILNLALLPLPIQEGVLLGHVKATERGLRAVIRDPIWPTARVSAESPPNADQS